VGKHDYVILEKKVFEGLPGEVVHIRYKVYHGYPSWTEGRAYVKIFGETIYKDVELGPWWQTKVDIPIKVPENVLPGRYKGEACIHAYETDCKEFTLEVKGARLKLQVNFPNEVAVGQEIIVTGKVESCYNSKCKPIPNAKVWVSIPGVSMPVYTNQKGEFTYKHRYPAWSASHKTLPIHVAVRYQGRWYTAHKDVPIKPKEYREGVEVLSHLVREGKPVIKSFDYKNGYLYIYFDVSEARKRNVYWYMISPIRRMFGKSLPNYVRIRVSPGTTVKVELMAGSTPYNYVWQEIVTVKTPSTTSTESHEKIEEVGVSATVIQHRQISPPRSEALVRVTNTSSKGRTVILRVLGLTAYPESSKPVEVKVYVPPHTYKLIRVVGFGTPTGVEVVPQESITRW